MAQYRSVFDIIGPIMIGPSSSHTAGAVSIGRVGNILAGGVPDKVKVCYYESFAKTHRGHGTDYAIVSGLLGLDPDDPKVPDALAIARERGMKIEFVEEEGDSPIHHPNTAVLEMDKRGEQILVWACSIGGGTIEVRRIRLGGYDMRPSGLLPMLFVEEGSSGRRDEALHDILNEVLGDEGEVMQKTIYPNLKDESKSMIGFDLDHPLPRVERDKIADWSSRVIYLY